ncbi:ribonuclease Z [Texcoconibacillus texcoconensis]|uniref:Ribonuclease Z n=1 Tax=Texcoconibacillus texcoconensis TaxID=1095777 RepID=A0A840QRA8_9BACI|nr:ribonuclease Z [Texcoconibacillus texcoconensis]MBB5173827.1 ribonuclease Z [Texcoconibacillus texcoconensis]
MKITFLGTGAGVPAKHRNVSSLVLHLMDQSGAQWMFDCGEATQQQILQTKAVKLSKIDKLFITHTHGDHIFGLPGFLGSRSFQGAESPLTIYGPKGIKSFIDTSLAISGTYLRYPLNIQELGDEIQGIRDLSIDHEEWSVQTAKLDHGVPCFGYRIQQKDKPGRLLMEKIREAGIPEGPVLKQLKHGETVTLKDGRTVNGKDFLGAPKKRKSIAILGDTRATEAAVRLAEGCDTLIHEATFSETEEKLAHEFYHSTTKQAADIAARAGVKNLILNHISTRYQDEDILYLQEEAQNIFANTTIAHDLFTF